ncbi:MAG: M20/M25/M40 family metallo-hydrolase, partial [Pseudomonadota bacterium]|nr:M20/M25/M40 family metallo-hydrolase [Pseudomonadota bacterium]
PAEEGGRGALPMVEAGVAAEAPHFYAAHLGLGLPSGVVAAEARGFLGSAKIDAVFEGRAAHAGAAPQDGRHAILAAAHAVGALQALPRHGAELTQVNVGRIEGGSGRNVIPDRCRIEFEVRAETEPTLDALHARALAALEGAAALAGCAVRTELMGRTASFLSSPEAAARVARVAAAQGTEVRDVHHVGGGEDAAFFVRAAQARGGEAGYFILGADLADGHHSPRFDFDEAALVPGAALFAALALDALSGAPA